MNSQLVEIIERKLRDAVTGAVTQFTPRATVLPALAGVKKTFCVIGMRRVGKTTFLHQCRNALLTAGRPPERLVYFNFEDERLGDLAVEDLALVPDIHARLYPGASGRPATFFLDEIQRVSGWERFARRLHDSPDVELFLSGSSAKMLSREVATSMRGRAWEIPIYPFSFGEYLRHHAVPVPERPGTPTEAEAALMDHHFLNYLRQGGFPEAQSLDAAAARQLLQSYVDTVILRDVVERHGVTNVVALRRLVRRLLSAPAGMFSITRFFADLKSQHIQVSRETLYALLDHLEDAFLVHAVPLATTSEKQRHVNPRKVYPVDTGLIAAFDTSGRQNTGHCLETAVFVECRRRLMEVAYVKTPAGFEVDFVAIRPDGSNLLIQACADLDDPDTAAREVRALSDARALFPDSTPLILAAHSRLPRPRVPAGMRVLAAWQWMLAGDTERR